MDPNTPTASSLLFLIKKFREVISYASASDHAYRIRPTISDFLTLPLLSFKYIANLDHSQARIFILILLLLIAAALMLNYKSSLTRAGRRTSATAGELSVSAIHALSKVIIPTCSVWPQYYLDLAHSAENSETMHIRLPLNVLFRDIRQGRIELRSPSTDLPLLIEGEFVVGSWTFDFGIDLNDRAKALKWLLWGELTFFPDEAFPKPRNFMEDENVSDAERAVLAEYCLQYAARSPQGAKHMHSRDVHHPNGTDVTFHAESSHSLFRHITLWPSLDTVPRALTEIFIRNTQKQLNKPGNNGVSVLSFTTTETSLSPLTKKFVLAVLPFSRGLNGNAKYDDKHSGGTHTRTPAPLLTPLPHILALLTSGPHAQRVLALSNLSDAYALSLDAHATALEYDFAARRNFIRGVGVQRWREERLYARWEAALLREGTVTRWAVVLGRKE
ncbi:hypothetical protein DFH11DRAFT_1578550 [Phellopilus nigrolimitatus]|nr:hypothetical protein DFH11DRAFT_1578550 [Phellopilus nigrolimitatus]